MPSTWIVPAENRDAEENDSTKTVYDGYTIIKAGNYLGTLYRCAIMFQAYIGQGTSIESAILNLHLWVAGASTTTKIYGEAIDDAQAIVVASGNISNRTKTSAHVIFAPGSTGGWVQADVTPILQEIIDRDGFASGNHVCLMIEDNGNPSGQNLQIHSCEKDPVGGENLRPYITVSPSLAGGELAPGFVQALRADSEWEILVSIDGIGAFGTTHRTGWMFPWFGEYRPILRSVSSILHKLQLTYGKTNLAKINVELIDRAEWGEFVSSAYLKNRRVEVMIGPKGGNAASFHTYFTGLVTDFSIGDEILSIEVQDDLCVAKEKIPEQNATKTQTLVLQDTNPIDIKTALLSTHGEVPEDRLNLAEIENVRDTWYQGWRFDRVLTSPKTIKDLITEIDEETMSVTFSDGDLVTMSAFAPPRPGETLAEIGERIQRRSLEIRGGMQDYLINNCIVLYDYDESGGDDEENYDSVVIVSDLDSQSPDEWDEIATKEIRSKWIRSYTIEQPSNVTGVVIYCSNRKNGIGDGTLRYYSSTSELSWEAPNDSEGARVVIDQNGKYQLFSGKETRYLRVVVTTASLPGSNKTDTLTLTALPGLIMATSLASHHVARYRDAQAELLFDLDLRDAVHADRFLRVSDVVSMTSDRIVTRGRPRWSEERIFLTSTRPDFGRKRFRIEAVQTSFKRRYAWIGPPTMTSDYDSATDAQKQYAFIADNDDCLGAANDPAYYIW